MQDFPKISNRLNKGIGDWYALLLNPEITTFHLLVDSVTKSEYDVFSRRYSRQYFVGLKLPLEVSFEPVHIFRDGFRIVNLVIAQGISVPTRQECQVEYIPSDPAILYCIELLAVDRLWLVGSNFIDDHDIFSLWFRLEPRINLESQSMSVGGHETHL